MEHKVAVASTEPHRSSLGKRMLALAALGMTSVACKASDFFSSPDPVYSFMRGAAGTVILEAELGAGKLVDYAFTKTQSCALGLLSLAAVTVPPLIVGALSIEHPAVGYAAVGIPVITAMIHLTRHD